MHKMQQNTFGGRAPPPSRKGRQRRGGTAGEGRVLTYKGEVGERKGPTCKGREGRGEGLLPNPTYRNSSAPLAPRPPHFLFYGSLKSTK